MSNSFANCWFSEYKLELIPVPVDVLSKYVLAIEAKSCRNPWYFGILSYQVLSTALSRNPLSKAVLLGKYLKFS